MPAKQKTSLKATRAAKELWGPLDYAEYLDALYAVLEENKQVEAALARMLEQGEGRIDENEYMRFLEKASGRV